MFDLYTSCLSDSFIVFVACHDVLYIDMFIHVVNSLVKQSPKFYRTCLSTWNSGITSDFKCNTKHHMPQIQTVDTIRYMRSCAQHYIRMLYTHRNAIHTQFQQTGTDKY